MESRHPTPIPHPTRRVSLVRGLIVATVVVLGALAVLPARAEAQTAARLAVTAVDPDGALPATPVVISGAGFGKAPEALFCWVDTGDGGFPFEVEAAADGRIDAVLGDVPSAATGSVKVWKGERVPLADRVVLSQGRLFSASDGAVFVSSATAVGPIFSAFGASPGTYGSVTVHDAQGEIRLDLGDLDLGGDAQRVRVTAVIETGGDSGNSSPPAGNLVLPASAVAKAGTAADPSWAATSTLGIDAPPPTVEALAAGLAEVLEAQLGSVGLTARAEGTELVVGHALGIRAGFLDLTVE